MESKKPNIVFILSDQQRADTCGCYGQKLKTTPNLDRIAEEGVLFSNAFTCQPICGPARAAIMSGKYPSLTNNHVNKKCLPLDQKTVADFLSESGYETGYIGKWHLASHRGNEGPGQKTLDCDIDPVPKDRRGGFKDFWLAADTLEFTSHAYEGHMFDGNGKKKEFKNRYRVDAQTDWVLDYLDSRKKDQPFFLFVSYLEPHQQNDHDHFDGPHGSKEKYKDFEPPGDLKGMSGNWRQEYPDYLGCVNSLDRNLGRILDKIGELDIKDDTIVIYTSDHGNHFKTRNKEYKRSCHDASIKIPMVISGGVFNGGKKVDELVSLIDIAPTLLEIAGEEVPDYMQGRKLQELLSGVKDWPEDLFIQISESQIGRAIRTNKWKYSVKAPDYSQDKDIDRKDSQVYVEDCLYDLERDPYEKDNLAGNPDYSDIRQNLRKKLLKRIKEVEGKKPDISGGKKGNVRYTQ